MRAVAHGSLQAHAATLVRNGGRHRPGKRGDRLHSGPLFLQPCAQDRQAFCGRPSGESRPSGHQYRRGLLGGVMDEVKAAAGDPKVENRDDIPKPEPIRMAPVTKSATLHTKQGKKGKKAKNGEAAQPATPAEATAPAAPVPAATEPIKMAAPQAAEPLKLATSDAPKIKLDLACGQTPIEGFEGVDP